jgi:hypothetical protein
MYFGGSIMTFALPYGAFIAAAVALYFIFRAKHSGPGLKYLSHGNQIASVSTREPGPAPAPLVLPAGPESAPPETAVAPGTLPPVVPAPEAAGPEATAPETAAPETAAPETDGGEA